ncbi:hypothetical protein BLNAU_25298 [Blattamonas nauphoetae]|uniref:Uncharacterized protein n=1 Tax=Blattamonas nauphoetae TaxID=2049346 RepID=A0ABQ9WMR1_9EUKA|nr:hypothetical protein BLNAU_25298 [Blattamonas nauphoetae]
MSCSTRIQLPQIPTIRAGSAGTLKVAQADRVVSAITSPFSSISSNEIENDIPAGNASHSEQLHMIAQDSPTREHDAVLIRAGAAGVENVIGPASKQ